MKYGTRNSSLFNKGNSVHTPKRFAHPTHALVSAPKPPSLPNSTVMGRRGNSTLFSCTWKLHKKKPHAVLANAHGSSSLRGNRDIVMQAGNMAMMVASDEMRWRSGIE